MSTARLLGLTPYNLTDGTSMPKVGRSDVKKAEPGTFTYTTPPQLKVPGTPVTVSSTKVTFDDNSTTFVSEAVGDLIASS